jgi:peptidoglycan/xylan/chitin deacetylase (PgdA/CDA1 family)
MLKHINFLNTTIICVLGVIAFFIFKNSYQLSYWYLSGLLFIFLVIQSLGAYFIQFNFHLISINSLATTEKKLLLTFDDGPHNPNTTRVLEVLKKHDVKALFFIIGKNIEGNETILKQIVAEGHQLANHSYSHAFWFDVWRTKKVTDDLVACQQLINTYQTSPQLFRPPYGVTNPNIAKAVKTLKLQSVGWNIRSYDTSTNDIDKITQRILSQLKPGSIILLHDRLEFMPQLLEKLIPAIKEKGYVFSNSIT